MKPIKIIECPRDAMQGIKKLIPTSSKVTYIQSLLRVGFDSIDFGSFVSPKSIPQMQDTAEVLAQLDVSQTSSKLLAIIANTQGAEAASKHKVIHYLGFPFSISENFQMRNTHKTIAESIITLLEILEIANKNNKEVVAYLSMGFGNPYGDPWNESIVGEWTEKLSNLGVKILSLSDTVGSSTPEVIHNLFSNLIPKYPQIEFDPYCGNWWVPGLQLGYEHSFVHAMVEFVRGLESGKGCKPDFKDGLATDYVTDAVLKSAKTRKWQKVKQT